VLVIWFVIVCGSDVNDVNGQVIGAAGLRDVCIMSAVVEGARIVAVAVTVAIAIVVKCVRLFADDVNDAEVGIAGRGGTCGDVNGNADRVIGAAVAVVVSFVVIVVAVAALGRDDGVDDVDGIV
jgi:hypothetical protein